MKSGAIVSTYNAGQAIGGLSVGYLADRISRKYTMSFAGFLGWLSLLFIAAAYH